MKDHTHQAMTEATPGARSESRSEARTGSRSANLDLSAQFSVDRPSNRANSSTISTRHSTDSNNNARTRSTGSTLPNASSAFRLREGAVDAASTPSPHSLSSNRFESISTQIESKGTFSISQSAFELTPDLFAKRAQNLDQQSVDFEHSNEEEQSAASQSNPAAIHNAAQIDSNTVESSIKEHLVNQVGHNRVRRYFSNSVAINYIEQGHIEIVTGDRFTLDMIERRLGDQLRIAAQFVLGTTSPTISHRVDPNRHQTNTQTSTLQNLRGSLPTTQAPAINPIVSPQHISTASTHADQRTHPLANRLDRPNIPNARQFPPCPSLDQFLVGSSNRLAFESIKQTIMGSADSPPVFIHGSCGVGKTHLLRGATRLARSVRPGAKVRYTTGEAFTNSFVNAIRTNTVEAFQKKYRGLDLLCIDDIHLMAGKKATQHHLLEIFNTLSLGGSKIILASDAHPREIGRLDQALSSRFSAGLVVRIEEPDHELSHRLVAHLAMKRGVCLDQAAISTIVDRVTSPENASGQTKSASVRDLEGAIVQIQAVARLMDQTNGVQSSQSPTSMNSAMHPTMHHIKKALNLRNGDQYQAHEGPIDLDTIINRICQEMTVSKSDLQGKGRQKKVVMARELIVHTARNLTSKSFPEIAYSIGRPNHSTVITAAKRFHDRIAEQQVVSVGCPHDGIPVAELAQVMKRRVSQRSN